MGLTNKYSVAAGRLPDLFSKIRDGQAPQQLTRQLLKDWGFTSSTDRAAIPLLKELGFLSPDGKPTSRYHEYRDHSQSKSVMAEAIHEAYGDLFLIKEQPTQADKEAILGKFKSFHNVSDNVAGWMTKTFYTLLELSDPKSKKGKPRASTTEFKKEDPIDPTDNTKREDSRLSAPPGLHYNIQIHLPATKDVEVYNAIFRSLKEHLLES